MEEVKPFACFDKYRFLRQLRVENLTAVPMPRSVGNSAPVDQLLE